MVDYVATTPSALAYFGLAYYTKNQDLMTAETMAAREVQAVAREP